MKILNKEIDFDFFDAKQMKKYEEESEKAQKEIKDMMVNIKTMKQSELINKTCDIIEQCFDSVFGENSSKKIFEGKKNFRLCINAFRDLVKARKEQEEAIDKEINIFEKELKEIDEDYKLKRNRND